jgi:coenzyme F420-dependent glucose-6-phosphate dehydrogenase
MQIGYKLSSEEHSANDLIRHAGRAEELGFGFAAISDHYHPWTDKQGHSPFVWNVLGGLAHTTERIKVLTAVTCPIMRIHPALIAQAAATTATMMPGRFVLGVGTGELLNEHILADHWPEAQIRLDMLEEAIAVMHLLWQGGQKSHRGKHYVVENAKVYDLPDDPVPVYLAAAGRKASKLAGRIGDGLIAVAPKEETVRTFEDAGGRNKPKYAEVTVCWGASEDEAKKTAVEWWPNVALPGELGQVLATPAHFEQACELVTEDKLGESIPCGPDPERHLESIHAYGDAGFDAVFVHQIGPDQDGFFDFFKKEVMPKIG